MLYELSGKWTDAMYIAAPGQVGACSCIDASLFGPVGAAANWRGLCRSQLSFLTSGRSQPFQSLLRPSASKMQRRAAACGQRFQRPSLPEIMTAPRRKRQSWRIPRGAFVSFAKRTTFSGGQNFSAATLTTFGTLSTARLSLRRPRSCREACKSFSSSTTASARPASPATKRGRSVGNFATDYKLSR